MLKRGGRLGKEVTRETLVVRVGIENQLPPKDCLEFIHPATWVINQGLLWQI